MKPEGGSSTAHERQFKLHLHGPVEQIVDADVIFRPFFGFRVGRNTDNVSDENQESFDQKTLLFFPLFPLPVKELHQLLGDDGEEGSLIGEELLIGLQVGRDLEIIHPQLFVLGRLVIEA